MCFRFASCLGVHVRDDDVLYGPTPPSKVMPPARHAGDTKTPAPAPAPRYVDEAGSRITRRPSPASPAPATAALVAGGHGAYAAGAGGRSPPTVEASKKQQAAAADEALKSPAAARNNKVVDRGAGNGAYHQYRYDEQPDREEGNKDCYTTTVAAGDHKRC
jgi:hypothetical protein